MSSNSLLWPSQGTKPEERLDKYKWLRLPSQGIGNAVLPDVMGYEDLDIMGYEPNDWFNALWQKRITRTINAGQVPSPLTNFTLLINNTFPELIGFSKAEIRFTGSDNVRLKYYIQEFDNTIGKLIARILKPTVAVGDLIRIYFDNSSAVSEEDPVAVWAGMDFVYPLGDATSNVTNLVGNDSTSMGTSQVDGKIFKATNFATNTQFIQLTSTDWTSQSNKSSFSIAFWYKSTDLDRGVFIGNFNSSSDFNLELHTSRLRIFITDFPGGSGTDVFTNIDSEFIDGNFHLVVFTYDGITRTPRLYFDGVIKVIAPTRPDNFDVIFEPTTTFFLARDSRVTVNYVGDLELFRKFDNITLDADTITTMFNNENDDDTFYSTGAIESVPTIFDKMGYEL